MRRADVDLVFLHVTTYALSSTVLPVVRRAKVPLVAGEGNNLYAVTDSGLYRTEADRLSEWTQVTSLKPAWFEDSKLVVDRNGMAYSGKIFAIGQAGKTVRVVETSPLAGTMPLKRGHRLGIDCW